MGGAGAGPAASQTPFLHSSRSPSRQTLKELLGGACEEHSGRLVLFPMMQHPFSNPIRMAGLPTPPTALGEVETTGYQLPTLAAKPLSKAIQIMLLGGKHAELTARGDSQPESR